MRVIFMGTPDFAVPSLRALVSAGHDVCAVYSQPPRRAGRGKLVTPSPVHQLAETLEIDVKTPISLRTEDVQAEFAALGADIAVVAAYGLILPPAILRAPRIGCINVHGSILPRWRGAAPVQRAILAGDADTGVTIMDMDVGLDTGAMRAIHHIAIDRKTAGELTAEIAETGAALLVQVLSEPEAYAPIAQPSTGITYAAKIDKSEAKLDFLISAPQVERQIRAFAPVPGAFFEYQGERFRILAADVLMTPAAIPGTIIDEQLTIACNPGAIRPTFIQRAGKSAMTPAELLRGFIMPVGTRLE
ncbi:MAG: methionyl-tRNA formyltransferase [Sphingomonadaceae bacterium]